MFSESDFSKLQQIMEESPEKKDLLERLLESHQMTISAVSHEIRNPMTLIYSTLQLIASQHPEVSSFKYWNQLMKDVEGTNLLLEELSVYNNSGRLNLARTDTASFLKTVCLSFAASIADAGIEFTSRIPDALPKINCDTIKLKQVLLNLLRNAQDGVLFGSNPSRQIRLEAFTPDGDTWPASSVCVKISDNGCGIPPERLEHIFEPFTTYKTGGTGLGLAIASRITRAHKGSLNVTSVPDELTVFSITLPV
ncbi:MAG: HAMP domain-containing histidine kinase [Dorea sp.]|nr:HAMP domain-containing histidine kinase [Dorea sp.]